MPPVSRNALLFCCLLPVYAHAQSGLQETVLVSAERIETDGMELPLSWDNIGEEALLLTAHIHINESMQRISGAWISRGNGQESLTALRSPVLTGAGSCGAFYVAWDNISLRAPGFCNVNQLFDANTEQAGRIEVIKGPATAIYGSNAMHGVINVLSASPEQTAHRLSLEAGPYDYYRAKYSYGGTQGRHGISVNLNGTTDGGYKDDSGYDQQKMSMRYDYQGEVWDISSALQFANLNQETAGFIQGYKAYEDPALKDSNPNPEAYRDARSLLAYSRFSRTLGNALDLTITPYLRDNDMEFLQHFLPWQPVEKNGHSSLGVRNVLRGEQQNWRWLAGVDLEYTDGWLKEAQDEDFSPNQPAGIHYDYQVDAGTAAAYSQVTLDASSRWELTAGLRLEYTHYDYSNRTGDGPACGPEATACRFYRPADRSDDFNDWTMNAGASFQLAEAHRLYVRAANGFRAPQTSELYRLQSGQQVADLDSEEITNIELGVRGVFSDKLEYQLSAYQMHKSDVIFQDADRQNVSGAKTKHTGIEGTITYSFNDYWYLAAALTSARHKYDSRINLLGSASDIKGNDIDTAPRLFGSSRIGANFDGWAGTGNAELEWVYMDSYYLEPDNEHEYDGHSLLNLRVSSQFTENWQAALRVTNLLDEDYAERADFGFGNYRYFVGQPLGAYVELSYNFGR